jgi:hypothetical protein
MVVMIECETKREAEDKAQWAQVIVKVTGGYMCFEYAEEYKTWRAQK